VSGEVNLSVAFINLAITLNLTNTDNTQSKRQRVGCLKHPNGGGDGNDALCLVLVKASTSPREISRNIMQNNTDYTLSHGVN
jgi:hypothetical protein